MQRHPDIVHDPVFFLSRLAAFLMLSEAKARSFAWNFATMLKYNFFR